MVELAAGLSQVAFGAQRLIGHFDPVDRDLFTGKDEGSIGAASVKDRLASAPANSFEFLKAVRNF